MPPRTTAKPKPAATDSAAVDQSTNPGGASIAPAVAPATANQENLQVLPDDKVELVSGEGGGAAPAAQSPAVVTERAAELAQLLPVSPSGQLVVAADLAAPMVAADREGLVGASANVAIVDEHDFESVGEPWHGLQRAASDVVIERLRQVHGEGFSFERDDSYDNGQLPRAAACYLTAAAGMPSRLRTLHWPFAPEWLKPGMVREDLVKAGALILAEIERLDRAEESA